MIAHFTMNGKSASVRIPVSGKRLAGALAYIGAVHEDEYLMRCAGITNDGVCVALEAENSAEAVMIIATDDQVSFGHLNQALEALENLPYEEHIEVKNYLMNNKLSTFDDLEKMLREATPEIVTSKFYCPLTVSVCGRDSWGDLRDESYEEDGSFAAKYEDEIRNALHAYFADDDETMADYYYGNNCVKAKLLSADWGVELKNGELFGCITVRTMGELSEDEEAALKRWIIGQNSDGFGESFEQREINYNRGYYSGVMYVSYWNSDDGYFLDNENEFSYRIESRLSMDSM